VTKHKASKSGEFKPAARGLPNEDGEKNLTHRVLSGCIPVSSSFDEGGGALLFEFSQVLQMGRTVVRFKEFELFASGEIVTLPAAVEAFFPAALPYLAFGWAAVASAGLFAAQFHHCAQQVIALVVILEFPEERHLCQHISHLAEPVVPQFLPKVS
jgi:hypothetical protein